MIVTTGVSNDVAERVKGNWSQKSRPYLGLLTPVKIKEGSGKMPE